MTHNEIVEKVKSILNEHGEVDALSIVDDRVQLENYINTAIPDAVVMLANRGYRVNAVVNATQNLNAGAVPIPADYVGLLTLKLDGWKRAVAHLTVVGSQEYNVAMNDYTRPGVNSPMCYRDGGKIVCLPTSGTTYSIEYNAVYDALGNADYELKAGPKEAVAVCYMAAALVLGMFGDDVGKQRLSDISTNMLQ